MPSLKGKPKKNMLDPNQHKSRINHPLTWFSGFGFLAICLYLLWIGKAILQPLFIAGFLVLILSSLADFFSRIKIANRQLPSMFCYLLALILVGGGLLLMAEIIIGNIARLHSNIGLYQDNIKTLLANLSKEYEIIELPSLQDLIGLISFESWLGKLAGGFTQFAGDLFSVILFSIFILLERTSLNRKLGYIAGSKAKEQTLRHSIRSVVHMIENYLGVKTLLSLATAATSFAILAWFDLDFAGFWALLIFLMNFIPYIGSVIAVLSPICFSLVQFADPSHILLLSLGLIATQIIIGNFLEPRVMGQSLNISPLTLLLTLAVFAAIWGIIGMILAIPFTVMLLVLCAQFPQTRLIAIFISADGKIDHLYPSND